MEDDMAEILSLSGASKRSTCVGLGADLPADAQAQIIIFPGVRYEKSESSAAKKTTKAAPTSTK